MAEHIPTKPSSSESSEIEVGQLFKLIGSGFRNIFHGFLKLFLFLKKNAIVLIILVVVGIVLALILNNYSPDRLKTEAIVKPNFESKDYLYDAIEEIKSNIAMEDSVFLQETGLNVGNLNQLHIEIKPIESENDQSNIENDIKYLQVLKDIPNDLFAQDILKSEILKKTVTNHRITFYYRDPQNGYKTAQKILAYINENSYFNSLKEIYVSNATAKIEENHKLIAQIDGLIAGYSKSLGEKGTTFSEGTLVLETEKGLDIPTLLNLKNSLIKEIERKKFEIIQQDDVIKVLNLSKPYNADRSFFEKRIVKFPLVLLGFFFLYSLLAHLNRKSKEVM